MCGIVGYVGPRRAETVLLEGLRRLEYRGYDSAGVAVLNASGLHTTKSVGKVAMLSDLLAKEPLDGGVGIAHTRWATHGAPSTANAHPHTDCRETLALVHNGIIENYATIKSLLLSRGHEFRSETDTEVLAHLLEEHAKTMSFEDAFFAMLRDIVGTFGIAVVSKTTPDKIYAARRGSPLVVGLGPNRDEFFIASDPSAILAYTRDVMYLDENEAAAISPAGVETWSIEHRPVEKRVETISWNIREIERGSYPHFMLKEMHEQPEVVTNATRGRLDLANGRAVLGGLRDVEERLRGIERLSVVACGSAYLAGTVGSYMLEEYAGVATATHLASEFRYRKPVIDPKREAVIAVSQSGETADTLGALREAKSRGALTLGVVNVVGSAIARETDAGVYVHAGPEIAVASTKAFLAQMTVFSLLTVYLGRQRGMTQAEGKAIVAELGALPKKIEKILAQQDRIAALAKKYAHYTDMFYLGRKYNAPVAHEGALKVKEIAYVHAEGYAAGEMKHGPIALLEPSFPVVAIVTRDSVYDKMRSNIEEARARRSPVIAIATEGDEEIAGRADDVLYVPETLEMLSPILNVLPLQLFAYFMAVERGFDPDMPRNLAKSVTVE